MIEGGNAMKLNEALNAIDTTGGLETRILGGNLLIFGRNSQNWFLKVPFDATTWLYVEENWESLDGVYHIDLRLALNVVQKLIDTPVEERFMEEKKYTIQVITGNEESYLNYDIESGHINFRDDAEIGSIKTEFTQSEIDTLKQRSDIAINWNKAIIEEV